MNLPDDLHQALEAEAKQIGCTLEEHIVSKLRLNTMPADDIPVGSMDSALAELEAFVASVPTVSWTSSGLSDDRFWYVKFGIDIDDELAWDVVVELGFVLNYLSTGHRLPTILMPVSPPPYLNSGGPDDLLSWVIESKIGFVDPAWILRVLESRLPDPLQPHEWVHEDEDEEGEDED